MEGLERQIRYVLEVYRQPALVEEYIDGREMNVGLIELNGKLETLPSLRSIIRNSRRGWRRFADTSQMGSEEHRISKIETGLSRARGAQPETGAGVGGQGGVPSLRMPGLCAGDLRVDHEGRPYVIEVNPNPDISPDPGMPGRSMPMG